MQASQVVDRTADKVLAPNEPRQPTQHAQVTQSTARREESTPPRASTGPDDAVLVTAQLNGEGRL